MTVCPSLFSIHDRSRKAPMLARARAAWVFSIERRTKTPPRFISTGYCRERGRRGLPRSMDTSARAWTCPPITRRGECRYRGRSRPTRNKRSISKTTSLRYSKKLSVDDETQNAAEPQPKRQALFHHRGAEFAEFGVFFD